MHRSRIAGPGRVARDEHRPLAGTPADDPGGLAGALQPGSPPVGGCLGRPGADPADPRLPHGRHPPASLLQPAAHAPPPHGGPAVFVAVLGWLFSETRAGSVLGLAERLTSSIQTSWPFTVALTLRRTRRPRPGPAAGRSGGAKDGATARARGPRPQAGLVMAAGLEAP